MYKNILMFFTLSLALFLTSCDEETNDILGGDAPSAVTNLVATSIDSTTIHIKWDATASGADIANFTLTVTDEPGNEVLNETISGAYDGSPVAINNLTDGTVYTFSITATNEYGTSDASTVSWSPAVDLDQTINNVEIRVYGADSQFGSGIDLFVFEDFEEIYGSEILTVANKERWNLALNTREGLVFGSSSQINLGSGTPEFPAEIGNQVYNVPNLADLFDSEALDVSNNYSESVLDLNSTDYADYDGIAFTFRINDNGSYNYGKILIKKINGSFLQDAGTDDEYIECVVSYQRAANVPYAEIEASNVSAK